VEELHSTRAIVTGRVTGTRGSIYDAATCPRKETHVEHAAAPSAPAAELRAAVLRRARRPGAAWVVVLIVTVAADEVGWNAFLQATVFLSAAYIIARGIAKAGKVYEGR
jgi:hypothetical protein